jgi:hypothetical protein
MLGETKTIASLKGVVAGLRITDAGLEHLKGLTRLNELGVAGTRVTESGIEGLRKALPQAQIVR